MYNIEIFFFLLKKNTGDREFFFTQSPAAGYRGLVKKKNVFLFEIKNEQQKEQVVDSFLFLFLTAISVGNEKKKGILVQTRKKKGVLVQTDNC